METLFVAYLFASVGQDAINISFCYSKGRLHDPTCFYIPYKLMYWLWTNWLFFNLFDYLFNLFFIICSVPWDQMTLSGYFKSAAICLLCGPAFFIINFSFLPFFMGIYFTYWITASEHKTENFKGESYFQIFRYWSTLSAVPIFFQRLYHRNRSLG